MLISCFLSYQSIKAKAIFMISGLLISIAVAGDKKPHNIKNLITISHHGYCNATFDCYSSNIHCLSEIQMYLLLGCFMSKIFD